MEVVNIVVKSGDRTESDFVGQNAVFGDVYIILNARVRVMLTYSVLRLHFDIFMCQKE